MLFNYLRYSFGFGFLELNLVYPNIFIIYIIAKTEIVLFNHHNKLIDCNLAIY